MSEQPVTPIQATALPVETPKKKKKGWMPSGCAVLLATVFVFLAVVALVTFAIWRVLFNPTLVKETVNSQVLSSDLVPAVMEIISERRAEQRVANKESLSGVNEPDIVLLVSYMKADDWRKIRDLVVDDAFVTNLVSVTVDGLYAWLDSDASLPDVTWNLTPLKDTVTGEKGEQAILVAYATLPECTQNEIDDFKARLAKVPPGVEVLYNLCRFPAPWMEDQVGDYIESLDGVNQNIPTQYKMSDLLGSGWVDPALLKSMLKLLRLVGQWGWVLPVLLLLLLLWGRVRDLRSLGKDIGIPLVVTGLLSVAVAVLGKASILSRLTSSLLANTSDFVHDEISASLRILTGLFFNPVLVIGLVLLVLGIVLFSLVFVQRRQD